MNQLANALAGPPQKIPGNAPADSVLKKARVGLKKNEMTIPMFPKQISGTFHREWNGKEKFKWQG